MFTCSYFRDRSSMTSYFGAGGWVQDCMTMYDIWRVRSGGGSGLDAILALSYFGVRAGVWGRFWSGKYDNKYDRGGWVGQVMYDKIWHLQGGGGGWVQNPRKVHYIILIWSLRACCSAIGTKGGAISFGVLRPRATGW